MDWPYVFLGLCALVLAIERMWRLRGSTPSLTQKSIIATLIAIAIAGPAYANHDPDSPHYPLTQALWFTGVCALIGSLEITFLTLKVRSVPRRSAVLVIAVSATIASLMLVTLPRSLEADLMNQGIDRPADHEAASLIYLVLFPCYVIWILTQPIISSVPRIPGDIRRRPIHTVALLMVSAGFGGLVITNATLMVILNTGHWELKTSVTAPAPLLAGVSIAGAALLAVGERLYDEITARRRLSQLNPLWSRMIQLSDHDLHLADEHLPTPARLQRAYVEISDAICSLRVRLDGDATVGSAASALRRGAVTEDTSVPTLSRALPERTTRREDLELIGALAWAYRHEPEPATYLRR